MWLAILLACLSASSAHAQQPRANRVRSVTSTCDRGALTVRLTMDLPFKGLVFTKDFSRECRVQGNLQKNISLHLPSNACGVRTSTLNSTEPDDEEDLYYTVELVVQMDRHLQQSTDQELLVRCKLQPRVMRINSSALENVITTKIREMTGQEVKKIRTGRNRQGFVNPADAEHRELLMESARAWMELAPAAPASEPATVEVGQPTRLLIQCTLPVGVGLRVTNCVAHDGLGEASQTLLDEAGCPIDESIFNRPTVHRHKHRSAEIDFSDLEPVDPQRNIDESTNLKLARSDPEYMLKNIMTYQHAVTTFAAFKFPDRAKLHLSCGIELCKGHCPVVDCKALQRPQQTRDGLVRKARLDKEAKGVVIDRLEVYNSIEVLAPNIELEDEASIKGSRRIESDEDEIVRSFSPGDKTICLSPGKMALAFCILGVIFLCAIAVAFVSLIRARRRLGREPLHTSLSFYTGSKSLFSSSESSSSGLSGSKLLLTDSPYLDHHSSSSNNWPYSRAF
ncbi:uncharacterized protein LOC126373319 [Pectinophora gossypiella]|uniref:uncharacterized protein LOC126373319 n=1 Tax=Pectinophora gossypiella TaxID=13191 RepID=UPI00214ED93D|nr:uncharacterized protein LOC126373319 [Pectinophora gossypiella]